jgi:hypothetical protein
MRPDDVEALIADIVGGRIEAPKRRSTRGRRKVLAAGLVVGVLGSGAAVAALWNRSNVSKPHEGIACHATADLAVTRAIVIAPAADPIGACTNLWRSGALPDLADGSNQVDIVPKLFVCVGKGGGLEVFPALSAATDSCDDLGLTEPAGASINDPLVALQDRLSNDINAKCTDLESARELVRSALSDLALSDWTITIRGDLSTCVVAGEDPDTHTVYLFSLPTQPPTT